MNNKNAPRNIDEYIAGFPDDVQARLQTMRTTIRKAAPQAAEGIKYQLPTFIQNGSLVHFGAFKKHIGFYAMPSGNTRFKEELSRYEGAKGSVKFPSDKPIPVGLVSKIVKFRVKENMDKMARRAR
ncbi:MAG: iron chaperone [Opitutaceae bacterium]